MRVTRMVTCTADLTLIVDEKHQKADIACCHADNFEETAQPLPSAKYSKASANWFTTRKRETPPTAWAEGVFDGCGGRI